MASTKPGAIHVSRYEGLTLKKGLEDDLNESGPVGDVRENGIKIEKEIYWLEPIVRQEKEFRGIRYSAFLPPENIQEEQLLKNIQSETNAASDQVSDGWRKIELDNGLQQTSPIGASYKVEWLED